MSARAVFSVQELAELRVFPGISAEELIRFCTLSAADEAFVRSMRQPATMLGVAVQLCSLAWLGFVPDEVAAAPVVAVSRPGWGSRRVSWRGMGAASRPVPIIFAR